uniref:Uncharacterized protein n=1 Tax=viral metagenome TaxID=1070528 RepID=A0A6C0LS00_9ZZZZ
MFIIIVAFISRFIHKNTFLYDTNEQMPKTEVLQHDNSNIRWKLRRFPFNTTGIDERYQYLYKEDEGDISDIHKWMEQIKLLKKLENNNIGEVTKLAEIDKYNRIYEASKMSPNLYAGGLFDDWNFAYDFTE